MPEIIIIAVVALILFGGKKLPEFMNGLGKGIREFKKSMNGVEEEIRKDLDTGGNAAAENGKESPKDRDAARTSGGNAGADAPADNGVNTSGDNAVSGEAH